jgi:CRISPR-associated protein Csm3
MEVRITKGGLKCMEKLLIKCTMTVLSGMHIGGGSAFSAIGAVDSPGDQGCFNRTTHDSRLQFKGKNEDPFWPSIKSNHYLLKDFNQDPIEIKRLFRFGWGSSARGKSQNGTSCNLPMAFIINAEFLKQRGSTTEVKFENTINRYTSIAQPPSD